MPSLFTQGIGYVTSAKNSKTPRWVLTEMSELKIEPLRKQAIKIQPLQFAYVYNTFLSFLPSLTHFHTDPANSN